VLHATQCSLGLGRTGGSHLSDDRPYTRDELRSMTEDWPARGPVCRHCGTRIPQFQDLSPKGADQHRDGSRDVRDRWSGIEKCLVVGHRLHHLRCEQDERGRQT
jgi:hypothetical protein